MLEFASSSLCVCFDNSCAEVSHTLCFKTRLLRCAQIENETVLWSDKPTMLEKLSSLVQSDVGAFSLRNYFLVCQVKFAESAIFRLT